MKKSTVTLIIENSKGEILLLLRDNKEDIPFPNQWYILGGSAEEGELPIDAIKREIKEEIEIELPELSLHKVYNWPEKIEYVYNIKMDLDLERTPLNEGQKLQYFSQVEIEGLDLGFHDKEIALDYFSTRIKENNNEMRSSWKLS
jgi:8-oxo-dGTP diphosphatase